MKIKVLNGSPRKENTAAMCEAFAEGAKEAGHDVEILHVGKMKIAGCLACEYCHGKGEGKCVQLHRSWRQCREYTASVSLLRLKRQRFC